MKLDVRTKERWEVTLPTFQVRIRDFEQWITLIEHGGLTAFNDLYIPGAYWTRWAQSIEAGTYPFFKP